MFSPEKMDPEPKNRSRLDILAKMLKVTLGGEIKTHIMYRSNLSYKQLERYLVLLEQRGLIQKEDDGGGCVYRATEKGSEFVREYSRLSEYVSGLPFSERSG